MHLDRSKDESHYFKSYKNYDFKYKMYIYGEGKKVAKNEISGALFSATNVVENNLNLSNLLSQNKMAKINYIFKDEDKEKYKKIFIESFEKYPHLSKNQKLLSEYDELMEKKEINEDTRELSKPHVSNSKNNNINKNIKKSILDNNNTNNSNNNINSSNNLFNIAINVNKKSEIDKFIIEIKINNTKENLSTIAAILEGIDKIGIYSCFLKTLEIKNIEDIEEYKKKGKDIYNLFFNKEGYREEEDIRYNIEDIEEIRINKNDQIYYSKDFLNNKNIYLVEGKSDLKIFLNNNHYNVLSINGGRFIYIYDLIKNLIINKNIFLALDGDKGGNKLFLLLLNNKELNIKGYLYSENLSIEELSKEEFNTYYSRLYLLNDELKNKFINSKNIEYELYKNKENYVINNLGYEQDLLTKEINVNKL